MRTNIKTKRLTREEAIADAIVEAKSFAAFVAHKAIEEDGTAMPPMLGFGRLLDDGTVKIEIVTAAPFHAMGEMGKDILGMLLKEAWDVPDVELTFHCCEAWEVAADKASVDKAIADKAEGRIKNLGEAEGSHDIVVVNIVTRDKSVLLSFPVALVNGRRKVGEARETVYDRDGVGVGHQGAILDGRLAKTGPEPAKPTASQIN
jgi:hypothetical protein